MRGIYWTLMPDLEAMNFFDQKAALPKFYWTGETRMNCLRCAIGQSLKHAYAHHIQRLMVTGNFALLAGVHPDAVDEWYLGICIDAIQWVELPNIVSACSVRKITPGWPRAIEPSTRITQTAAETTSSSGTLHFTDQF
jgi:deoxyribodipyrimidine photolyase-like uncharacterized protein